MAKPYSLTGVDSIFYISYYFQNEDNFMLKLNTLTLTETRILLSRFFEKVVNLRESVQSKDMQFTELEVGSIKYCTICNIEGITTLRPQLVWYFIGTILVFTILEKRCNL